MPGLSVENKVDSVQPSMALKKYSMGMHCVTLQSMAAYYKQTDSQCPDFQFRLNVLNASKQSLVSFRQLKSMLERPQRRVVIKIGRVLGILQVRPVVRGQQQQSEQYVGQRNIQMGSSSCL
jgi:hypothetical protein